MAVKRGHELGLIDVVLITIKVESISDELAMTTINQITVDPQIQTTQAIQNIVKGILIAQKRQVDVLTGNTITIGDNVYNPELIKMLQGGKIEYDEDGNFKKYSPPAVGEEYTPTAFTMYVYTAQYDASGLIVGYMKTTYPNCTGVPVSMSSQDDVFMSPEYSIISAPGNGESAYEDEFVKELPEVGNPDWKDVLALRASSRTSSLIKD